MRKPLSNSLLYLCVVLTCSQIAHAERLTLEGTALSFERPNELFAPLEKAPHVFTYGGAHCDECDLSAATPIPALIEVLKINSPWKTVKEYVAAATKGTKKLIAPREEKIAGLRAVEVATEGPGAHTHWTRGTRDVNHMYVFKYGDGIYVCHLLSKVDTYRSVIAEFQSFCKSVRTEGSL